jgi:hypothetical protein
MQTVAVATRSGLVQFVTWAPLAQSGEAAAAAAAIWSSASVSPQARVDDAMDSKPFRDGQLLGIVLGSILFTLTTATTVSWVLVKFSVPVVAAAAVAFAIPLALVTFATVSAESPTLLDWAKLGGYLLTSVLAFVPLTKWLALRARRPRSQQPSTGSAE